MSKRFQFIVLLLCLGIGVLSAGGSGEKYTTVSPEELAEIIENEDPFLVNMITGSESIPGTDLTMSQTDIEADFSVLPGTDEAIALYCQSGAASRPFAKKLAEAGYENILWLDGGIMGWKKAGLEVE